MRYSWVVLSAFVVSGVLAQAPNASQTTSLLAALQELPSRVDSHTFDSLAFSNILDGQLNAPSAEVEEALPLLKQYIQSQNIEVRRNALLTIYALDRRPNSVSELASLLPALYSHLGEQDIYLRQGALLAVATLQPAPPSEAITSLTDALAKANTTDGFGRALAGTLIELQPSSDETQNAVFAYLHRPDLTDSARADVIDEIAGPRLGERLTQEIVALAKNSPPGRLRNSSIDACAKTGPRAASQITAVLDTIQADTAETPEARAAASRARAVLNSR